MIPLKDDVPSRSVPFVTIALIAVNLLAFVYQFSLGIDRRGAGAGMAEALVMEFGLVPCRLTGLCPTPEFPNPVATVFTSMFLHGGLLHIGGNMLYLWIFGDNVEDRLGHFRFLLFYVVCGVAAALAQTVIDPTSRIPMVGASGAVSGLLGAYLLLFPYATILTLLVFFPFFKFVHVPVLIVLGFWIVLQVLNGFITVSAQALGRGEMGGIAWFAHIGGFMAGMVLLFLLQPRRSRRL